MESDSARHGQVNGFDGLGLSDDQLKECQKRHIEHEKEQDAKIEALMNMSTCKGDMHWAS